MFTSDLFGSLTINVNNFLVKLNTLIALLLIVGSALASPKIIELNDSPTELTLEITEKYVFGDGDTLVDAKQINIEQVKKSAADYAGTYVEQELVVSDNKITKQQIRVLTAGFIEVVSRDDKRNVNNSGELCLITKAKIKLSKESIKDGLDKLKTDPARLNKISILEKDNGRLRKELYELTKKINSGASRTDLSERRKQVLSDLDKNSVAANIVFSQGSLFKMALLDIDEYEIAKADLDDNFFGGIKNETKVTLGQPKFVRMENGKYDCGRVIKYHTEY